MMRILFAIPTLKDGGAERVVSVWANELNAKGYDVSIMLFVKTKEDYPTDEGVKILAVTESQEEYKALSNFRKYGIVRRMLGEIKPNYVVSFLPAMQVWVMLGSLGMSFKRIETIRINPWKISITGKRGSSIWRLCYKTGYKILLQASDQASFFTPKEQEKCVLIPNPISEIYTDHYKTRISETPVEFIAVGRIVPYKNHKMMIKAFGEVCRDFPDIRLRIFGAGKPEYVEEIQEFIARESLEKQVFLAGRTMHIEDEYQSSDVYLMTSSHEGLPNALMEAMASRLICISTDCKTGIRDLIEDGVNGYLVPVGDEMALAQKIRLALGMSRQEREQMAESARTRIMTYCSRENSVEKLCELFE